MKRIAAYEEGKEVEADMLLDLLDAATGMKCSLAHGGGMGWQIMDEMNAGGLSREFFLWQVIQFPDRQWFPTTLEAAHDYLEKFKFWRKHG